MADSTYQQPTTTHQKPANTYQKSTITAEAARQVVIAAEARARAIGVPMCIAVADSDGHLKAFSRMDGAALLSIQIAQDKAFTAVSFGDRATHEWYEAIKDDPPLLYGIVKTERLVIFGGGYALKTAEGVVGGIGVSGGSWQEDMDVAEAGLKLI